ncbi:MAG: hypothetical protein QXO84_00015 [Candidatus Aenigmatarchaeota archaeon]
MRFFTVLALIIFIIFLSGCVNENKVNGNILIQSSYTRVKNNVKIYVDVTNTLKNEIRDVDVSFDSLSILELVGIENCENKKDFGCKIERMEPGEKKRISFSFKIPETISDWREISLNPILSVSYDYSDETLLTIPILGKDLIDEKNNYKLYESDGPLKVVMSLPSKNSKGNEMKSVYGGDWFVLEVKILNTGGNIVEIKKNNFFVEFSPNTFSAYKGDDSYCDFETSGNHLELKEDVVIYNEKSFLCTLLAKNIENTRAWETGSIKARYSYRYKVMEEIEIS